MYKVLARKWRPQSFNELIGQPNVARTLSNAITADHLAHAYIFAGLRGTGKTTVARILAKCVNCEQGPTVTPCNKCAACEEITESRALDVLEIDAASRTKVEQTRELLEVVSYAPVRDRHKILIIDEAHMLSKASFNALLKTLEEPPPNVLFILATTELQKILPTILSRCQVFEFRRVGAAEVAGHLRKICDDEKIEISTVALDRLARGGEGSVRDSLSLLERALAFCGPKIDDDDVLRMLGSVHATVLVDFVGALAKRDAGSMLQVLDGLIDEGHDLLHFWNALITVVRDLLLLRALPDRTEMLSMPPDEAAEIAGAAEGLSREDLTRVFQILADLEHGLKTSAQPRFLFEAALIRLASLGAVRPIEDFIRSLDGREIPSAPAPAPVKKKSRAEPAATTRRTSAPETPGPPAAPTSKVAPEAPVAGSPEAAPARRGTEADLISAVHAARPMLAAILEQAASLTLKDGRLEVRFPEGLEVIQRQIQAKDSVQLLGVEAAKLVGGPVTVNVTVESGQGARPAATDASPRPKAAVSRAAGSAEPPPPGNPGPAPPAPEHGRPNRADSADLLEQARREPGVRKLMDAFGAHVVDIRPLEPSRKPTKKSRPARSPEDSP